MPAWVWVPSAVYVLLFIASRGQHFMEGYAAAVERHEHNAAFREDCANAGFRKRLGHYAEMCEDELRASMVSPMWHGFEHAYANTYACGGTPCADMLRDAVSNPYTLLAILVLAVTLPYIRALYRLAEKSVA